MKIVWLCYYSLTYLKDYLDCKIDPAKFHPATWMYFMTREFLKQPEIELHLIVQSSYLDKDYEIKENNITYHLIRNVPRLTKLGEKVFWRLDPFFNFSENYTIKKIKKKVLSLNPDLINAHGTEGVFSIILNDLNFPSIIWMQGMINQVINFDENPDIKKRLKRENAVLTNQNHFITFPGEMEETILRFNPKAKFYNICHPNSSHVFELKNQNERFDADLVFNGAIIKRKGIEELIEAVKLIKKSINGIRAKIIGYPVSNQYGNMINEKIKEYGLEKNINFIGFLESHDEVLMEIKKSKIFVLPTHVDTGPRSVAEAMTIGVPVISSNIDGLRNMIQNRKSGILIDVGDVESLAEAIIELLNDAELRQKYAEEAYKFAIENYYPSNVIDKIISTYSDVINEYKGSAKKISIENFEVEKI